MLGSNAGGRTRVGWRWWLGAGLVLSIIPIWIPQPVYAAVGGFALTQWRTLLTGLVVVGLAVIAGSTVVAHKRSAQEASTDDTKPLLREIPGWAIWAGMACLVVIGLLATWWLVTTYGSGEAKAIEQNRIKLEAIKLAGSVVVGTGGVAALLLAARRQRVSELDLLQRDRIADSNRHDADERRATELYTAAAEQLASDKAPVRMAGLYALSRLGETNTNLRQTIINLLCAYLRMPDINTGESTSPSDFTPDRQADGDAVQKLDNPSQTIVLDLASAPLAALTSLAPDLATEQKQEHQVRITAQRLLSQHLLPNRHEHSGCTDSKYWPDMDIDLADANLHDWDFTGCEVRSAEFRGTKFHGTTRFDGAQFEGIARFEGAEFHGTTRFDGAEFHDTVRFDGAEFHGITGFDDAQFHGITRFDEAQLHGYTEFSDAKFRGTIRFYGSQFHGITAFRGTRFHSYAGFSGAEFHNYAGFAEAQFYGRTQFDETLFEKKPSFEGAWARLDPSEEKESTWPPGWAAHEVNLKNGRENQWGLLSADNTSDFHEPETEPRG